MELRKQSTIDSFIVFISTVYILRCAFHPPPPSPKNIFVHHSSQSVIVSRKDGCRLIEHGQHVFYSVVCHYDVCKDVNAKPELGTQRKQTVDHFRGPVTLSEALKLEDDLNKRKREEEQHCSVYQSNYTSRKLSVVHLPDVTPQAFKKHTDDEPCR